MHKFLCTSFVDLWYTAEVELTPEIKLKYFQLQNLWKCFLNKPDLLSRYPTSAINQGNWTTQQMSVVGPTDAVYIYCTVL